MRENNIKMIKNMRKVTKNMINMKENILQRNKTKRKHTNKQNNIKVIITQSQRVNKNRAIIHNFWIKYRKNT